MERVSPHLMAKIGVGVLMIIVIGSLFEILRIDQVSHAGAPVFAIRPFVLAGLAGAFSLALSLVALQAERPRASFGVAIGALLGLLVYRFAIVP